MQGFTFISDKAEIKAQILEVLGPIRTVNPEEQEGESIEQSEREDTMTPECSFVFRGGPHGFVSLCWQARGAFDVLSETTTCKSPRGDWHVLLFVVFFVLKEKRKEGLGTNKKGEQERERAVSVSNMVGLGFGRRLLGHAWEWGHAPLNWMGDFE